MEGPMAEEAQSYASHRMYYWPHHFVAMPILILNFIWRVVVVVRWWSWANLWEVILALGLVALMVSVRVFAVRLQDRIIRAEERARLREAGLDPSKYSMGQLIAMRFCADEELPELARAVADENLRSREAIKKRIKNWRADRYRI